MSTYAVNSCQDSKEKALRTESDKHPRGDLQGKNVSSVKPDTASVVSAKASAKRLKKYLATLNTPINYSHSLEAVAIISGFKDWNTFYAHETKSIDDFFAAYTFIDNTIPVFLSRFKSTHLKAPFPVVERFMERKFSTYLGWVNKVDAVESAIYTYLLREKEGKTSDFKDAFAQLILYQNKSAASNDFFSNSAVNTLHGTIDAILSVQEPTKFDTSFIVQFLSGLENIMSLSNMCITNTGENAAEVYAENQKNIDSQAMNNLNSFLSQLPGFDFTKKPIDQSPAAISQFMYASSIITFYLKNLHTKKQRDAEVFFEYIRWEMAYQVGKQDMYFANLDEMTRLFNSVSSPPAIIDNIKYLKEHSAFEKDMPFKFGLPEEHSEVVYKKRQEITAAFMWFLLRDKETGYNDDDSHVFSVVNDMLTYCNTLN